jgi:dipeptidyl aminopeptidase/acylaminoacyl peptidase
LWTSTRAAGSSEWSQPIRLLTLRGLIRELAFAPDGSQVVFTNARSVKLTESTSTIDYSFIVVFDMRTRHLAYLDPSFDTDTNPIWSGDGRQVSFARSVPGHPVQRVSEPVPPQAIWSAPPKRHGEPFTLAAVLSAPIISSPQPSGDGRALTYTAREGSERRVYLLPASGPARCIAKFAGDDGQELGNVAISRTGAAIAFTRGGPPNDDGDSPNPASSPDSPREQLWIVAADGSPPRFLGVGSSPQFTPDDHFLVWQAHDTVVAVALVWKSGHLDGVSVPQEFLSGRRDILLFSPDGTHAAYIRNDGIEVIDLATHTAIVIPHAGQTDDAPVWSPDGRQLAFLRHSRPPDKCGNYRFCGPVIAAEPWSIWTSSIIDPQPHKLWQADSGIGSVYYPLDQSLSLLPGAHGNQLFWSADNHIAFVWERDGWRHLYAIPANGAGATPTLLSPGEGEIETVALARDRRHLFVATNIGDLGRRHIAMVSFDAAGLKLITSGDASEWSPTPLAAGACAFVRGGWNTPPVVVVRAAAGQTHAATLPRVPAMFPASQLVKPRLVEFPGLDGQKAFGQLFVPRRPQGCAVIFAHGGIVRQMLPGYHYMDAYSYLYEINQYIAARGCVVLSVEYRSSIMRGYAFRNAPGWGFAGNAEMLDVIGGAHYLLARKEVDPHRLGIYGLSWGGYITSLALAHHSELFAAGADFAGVHTSTNDAGIPVSPVANIATWSAPVFLAQGDDDRNVSFAEGLLLARALQEDRPAVEFVQRVDPGETHELDLTFSDMVSSYGQGIGFLLGHLGLDDKDNVPAPQH